MVDLSVHHLHRNACERPVAVSMHQRSYLYCSLISIAPMWCAFLSFKGQVDLFMFLVIMSISQASAENKTNVMNK